jgi:hypothetical protein
VLPRGGAGEDGSCLGQGCPRGRIEGLAGRGVRSVPGVPRRDHRQRGVPVDPGLVPGHLDRRPVLVLNAYNIVFAAFLIVFGRLTDLVGRRRGFVAGVVVFTVASLLCGAAPWVEPAVEVSGGPAYVEDHAFLSDDHV